MATEVLEAGALERTMGLVADVRVPPDAVAPLRGSLAAMGRDGWKELVCGSEDDGRVWLRLGLARPSEEWDRALLSLQKTFKELSDHLGLVATLDWQTRLWEEGGAETGAIRLSPRWVAVSGEAPSPQPGSGVILVERGWVFGSGAHPSTQAAAQALEWLADRGSVAGCNVLDVGAGSGILALLAAGMGSWSVLGVDVDPEARRRARRNVRRNGLERKVAVVATPVEALPRGSYDLIIANLAPSVLHRLAPALALRLSPLAALVVAGFQRAASDEVTRNMVSQGLKCLRTVNVREWMGKILVWSS